MKKPSDFSSLIFENFLSLFRHSPDSVSTIPLREEVFSVEGLEQYATELAQQLTVYPTRKKGRSLNPILKKHAKDLESTYKVLIDAIRDKHAISPAAEWLVDNYHIIEEQLRDIRLHLPPHYYNGLPKLSSGPLKDYPRIYAIALSFLAHTDCRLNTEALRRFVAAFQKVSPLSIGELWALSISLRVALIDFLKPIAMRVLHSRINREKANSLADQILLDLQSKESDHTKVISFLEREMGNAASFDRALIVQLVQRLRDQDPDVWPVMEWIEEQLGKIDSSSQKLIQLEHQRQAAAQVTIGNILGSMRLLTVLDWREIFEDLSLVDKVLVKDPVGAYANMEFSTRDSYRHVVEIVASRCDISELKVAQAAVDLAANASREANELKIAHHVGYFLVDKGRLRLESKLSYRLLWKEKLARLLISHPTFLYIGMIALLSALVYALLIGYLGIHDSPLWLVVLMGIAILLPVSEFATGIINHYVTSVLKPVSLPKMDTKKGIAQSARTMVVVPTLFTSKEGIQNLLSSLLVNFIANRDKNIYFALLGDFSDADQESLPGDSDLIEFAQTGIKKLNAEYFPNNEAHFHLFSRSRKWNPSEEKWIGWERKRGKLEEFNLLLRGATNTSYIVSTADAAFLKSIKYVISLDSDTRMPRDSARRLIGTITHPLNHPVIDVTTGRVTQGYGVLQPRVSVSAGGSTRFANIFASHTGLDPYTTAVSDVYQDLFHEGSFTGKGLYDIDVFQSVLENRVPENYILSHDLFEGSFARCALVSDIEIFDDYPTNFDIFAKRLHRWTRGDWQIARWISHKVPNYQLQSVPNTISLISKWKIFDNLRRSLISPTLLLCFTIFWSLLPGSPLLWSLALFLLILLPSYVPVSDSFLTVKTGVFWKGHIRSFGVESKKVLTQVFFTLAFLPDLAWVQVDAILRTFYRKHVSRKNLLEWMTFAATQSQEKTTPSLWQKTGPGPLIAVVNIGLIGLVRPSSYLVAGPLLLLWLVTPLIKLWLSRSPTRTIKKLGQAERESYRSFARLTWNYFESFATAEENWLAPDNYQEDPTPVVAHRSSPTNFGLQLLATCSAKDMGYISLSECLERLENTFKTLEKLERLHGHFYNWYDTQTLLPLNPRYISTVDSGNLAGHLLAVKQSCCDWMKKATDWRVVRSGLIDTIRILKLELNQEMPSTKGHLSVSLDQVRDDIVNTLSTLELSESEDSSSWLEDLEGLWARLTQAEDIISTLATDLSSYAHSQSYDTLKTWTTRSIAQVKDIIQDRRETLENELPSHNSAKTKRLYDIVQWCDELFDEMDFSFLYDKERKTFVIGYNIVDDRKDNSYYDLLASESRLASFVAIAKSDVPQEHWFHLNRPLAKVKGGRALVSWTGTMFEYLMPLLVMKDYQKTLLHETYLAVLKRQIEYGEHMGVPWGISEAGYNARDLQLNFQYGPFGVPGLGLKRGLSDDLVISPYSTMIAAMIDPWKALKNLGKLKELGMLSEYGFYESIDFTPERMPPQQKSFTLRSFMAHHQGMSLVAINNILNDNIMQERFHTDPLVQSTALLLQEKVPQEVLLAKPRQEEVKPDPASSYRTSSRPRSYSRKDLTTPRTQILSNGNYSVLLRASGTGYSRCGKLAVNRWREDAIRDNWGQFIYIRNRHTSQLWSAGFQPTATEPSKYDVSFSEDRVNIHRRDENITTHTEIIVSPEDNVELRRVSLSNHSLHTVEIEVTSYFETVFAPHVDDVAHPAFSNLFVQTEFIQASNALIATRRKRSAKEADVCGFHVVLAEGQDFGVLQYETDRNRFIGRGRSSSNPLVIDEQRPLSNTVGSVLDPIFSLRRVVQVKPGETTRLCFATGMATSRAEALELCDKYHDPHIFSREAELAWTHAQVHLRHLNISPYKAHHYQSLASHIIYSNPSLRPRPHALAKNTKSQTGLWAYGISGDLPIVLSSINDEKDMLMVRELLHAHEYLRLKGLVFDLVILNERAPSYFQGLQDELQRQIRICGSKALLDKSGGVFLRRTDIIPEEDLVLLRSTARVILQAGKGTLSEQLKRVKLNSAESPLLTPKFLPTKSRSHEAAELTIPELKFFNGLGGFSDDGRSYCIVLGDEQWTPAPWINVVANQKDFGFIISESGSGYTWSENSRENRLTPWSNDTVSDPTSECVYIRDEENGEFWSPTPLPARGKDNYLIKHTRGSTRFEHNSSGLQQSLEVFAAPDDRVKITRVKIKNLDKTPRNLSITNYVEWNLGFSRGSSAPFVITEIDPKTQAILARNPYNNEFSNRIAFQQISETARDYTCDRNEFIGPQRSLTNPAALEKVGLLGTSGAGIDPCGALQHKFTLAPGETKEFFMLLGQGDNMEEVDGILSKFSSFAAVENAFKDSQVYWDLLLGGLQIQTPDEAMNILVNNWLLYQTLSCRIWARSAFYQSGGAYGFRDQLQDVMALVYTSPDISREHILRAAGRQFPQGDVQHWWHPPTGRGVRTRFSDDLLWLPFVTSYYLKNTEDLSILDETSSFIEAPLLAEGVDDAYTLPETSSQSVSLLEHCALTIDRSLEVGAHGLPLMGSGDWNDGMSEVGPKGKGESVWVAWFLYTTIEAFLPYIEAAGGQEKRVKKYKQHLIDLKEAVEAHAWDGDWYRRAYFDDGTPLGSSTNDECRIDSITQSWSVLSGAGDPERSQRAMAAVDELLIDRGDGLIKLFTPPFDKGVLNPGYIKGYVPGVRENGGQYTHAALWTLMAFAKLGDGNRAAELYSLLNPINHSSTRAGLHKYKVEPYVAAADIYGLWPHVGRGGWTWYTGSASWMYRAAVESLLGFELRGDTLSVKPCVPREWNFFQIEYRWKSSLYKISLRRNSKSHSKAEPIELIDDGKIHEVEVLFN